MNKINIAALVVLALMACFQSVQAKEPSEYTDRELLNAGWSQEQIDDLKGRVSKAPPPPPQPLDSNSKEAIAFLNDYTCEKSVGDGAGLHKNTVEFANEIYMRITTGFYVGDSYAATYTANIKYSNAEYKRGNNNNTHNLFCKSGEPCLEQQVRSEHDGDIDNYTEQSTSFEFSICDNIDAEDALQILFNNKS